MLSNILYLIQLRVTLLTIAANNDIIYKK